MAERTIKYKGKDIAEHVIEGNHPSVFYEIEYESDSVYCDTEEEAKLFVDRLCNGDIPISYCIEEEFYFPDGDESKITVTGDEIFYSSVFDYSDEWAKDFLMEQYNDWIAGTEPDDWYEDATKICIAGYFWVHNGEYEHEDNGKIVLIPNEECAVICVKTEEE